MELDRANELLWSRAAERDMDVIFVYNKQVLANFEYLTPFPQVTIDDANAADWTAARYC